MRDELPIDGCESSLYFILPLTFLYALWGNIRIFHIFRLQIKAKRRVCAISMHENFEGT
jgi:hypothetical protein